MDVVTNSTEVFGEKEKLNCRAHYISLLITEIETCAMIFSLKIDCSCKTLR